MRWTILAALFLFVSAAHSQVIQEQNNPKRWTITTSHSQQIIAVASDGIPVPIYYGPIGEPPPYASELKVNPKVGSEVREVPFRGGFDHQVPAIEVVYADGTRDCNLIYDSAQIADIDGQPGLQIHLKDSEYGLEVTANYRVFPDQDITERWLTITNHGNAAITLENAQSASVELPSGEYDLTQLAGEWAHEFTPFTSRITPGVKTIQVRDFQGLNNPPWVAIRPAGERNQNSGNVYFAALHYSGNWRLDVAKTFPGDRNRFAGAGDVQIVGGINFWDTALALKPGETFTTPKMTVGFATDSMDGAANRLQQYTRKYVLPAHFRDALRPVIYNSWYATVFNVNEAQQLALAKVAKQIGVELFVMDDGWFKGRTTDHAGLGDWTPDPQKFPHGLQPLIKQINDLGMDYGLWVEPEMVNPDSDLYRAHPDWVFYYPKRERHEQRNQLMLNMAREDVYQYTLGWMSKLLSENNIRFIKWDHNRALSEPGWPDAPPDQQRAVRILYMQNLYRLIDTLRAKFPDVLFEDCASGGARADLGMLERTDQVWASDNTNPDDRLFIQWGYLSMLPANTMVSWVTDEDWHRGPLSMNYRFAVSMQGVLGVGGNITKWPAEDLKTAARMISLYKEIRPIIQHGSVYRLISPFDSNRVALEYVAQDGSQAVLFCYTLEDDMAGSRQSERVHRTVYLRGLDPNAQYTLSGQPHQTLTGQSLMNVGIPWPIFGDYNSRIIRLTKVDK
ncbi:MAG TPA: alpha-galactosidase [Tepidisphaeraceae bacterium]|jgi:alpha-galactosidase